MLVWRLCFIIQEQSRCNSLRHCVRFFDDDDDDDEKRGWRNLKNAHFKGFCNKKKKFFGTKFQNKTE